jgi:ribosomal protein S18 acetylase RimI-like enzyme
MAEVLEIRRATEGDVPFLVEAICEAEKSGTEILSYSRIFDLPEDDVRALLRKALVEDLVGQELCISGFLVVEMAGAAVAACCAWVEGVDGIPSAILKANLLVHFLKPERLRAAERHFKKLDGLTLPREVGAIQIESVYVKERARGRGLAGRLIARHFEEHRPSATAKKAQVILAATNRSARIAYENLGFFVALERASDDEALRTLVPATRKILMETPLAGAFTDDEQHAAR